ncbi:MAG TPA: hypothetical protein VLA39_07415 [Marinobacterium sp.]|nr:hypothetical protein [Marinobacterium sp.]
MSETTVEKTKLKVYVKMSDGQRLLGFFYVSSDERLQDILNDDRGFLPLHAVGDNGKYSMVVLSKRYMQQIEEVSTLPEPVIEPERRVGGDRRDGTDRRQAPRAPKFELD